MSSQFCSLKMKKVHEFTERIGQLVNSFSQNTFFLIGSHVEIKRVSLRLMPLVWFERQRHREPSTLRQFVYNRADRRRSALVLSSPLGLSKQS